MLTLTHVGKSYRSYSSIWWRAAGWITGRPSHFSEHWVLRDVSFAVQPGEAIGIVGRNGAGKSTLLKLIAGTLTPTEGRVVAQGRVSAILELGMGFNPEFTGRENAIHACGLLGYEPARIAELVPWIEQFADIGEYFDQPARTYSSGMTMRVGFGVATATRPDVLIVDEALSVGDAAFQRKSFRRIEDFVSNGTALLFVSHSTETVKHICDRAIWLSSGRVAMQGESKSVVESYERDILGARPIENREAWSTAFLDPSLTPSAEAQYGSGDAQIDEFTIEDETGTAINVVPEKQRFTVSYRVRFLADCEDVEFGVMVKTVDGVCVYATNSADTALPRYFHASEVARAVFRFENNLMPGIYFLNCGVTHQRGDNRPFLHRRVDVAAMRITPQTARHGKGGLANLVAQCEVAVANDAKAVPAIALIGSRS